MVLPQLWIASVTNLSPGESCYCVRRNEPVRVEVISMEVVIHQSFSHIYYECIEHDDGDEIEFSVNEKNIFTTPGELLESIKLKLEV